MDHIHEEMMTKGKVMQLQSFLQSQGMHTSDSSVAVKDFHITQGKGNLITPPKRDPFANLDTHRYPYDTFGKSEI